MSVALKNFATVPSLETDGSIDALTNALEARLSPGATSLDVDLHKGIDQVLVNIGMTSADSGRKLTFYGRDPILPSRLRFCTIAGHWGRPKHPHMPDIVMPR
jgi:hypothetical protein